jgi:hypothetical protein
MMPGIQQAGVKRRVGYDSTQRLEFREIVAAWQLLQTG